LLLTLTVGPVWARNQELKTVELAADTVHALSAIPFRGIPRSLLREAAGVAIIPHVVKAGLVIDRRFGRGVILIHEPDGRWSAPVFVTLTGHGIGGQLGIESTDLVLVFKTHTSLQRALRGKLTLGGDVSVAAGPLGREAEAATDRRLKAEIYSYSRSRGLFVGMSLEGSRLEVDVLATAALTGPPGPAGSVPIPIPGAPLTIAVEKLKEELARLSSSPIRPTGLVPPETMPPPLAQPAVPPQPVLPQPPLPLPR